MEDRDISLVLKLKENGIDITNDQAALLNKYYDMVVEKNKVMNLTAITEYDEFVLKHFVDSLSLVKTGIDISGKKIIDVGTGAGFPGIPLKIVYPDADIVLMDDDPKKIAKAIGIAKKCMRIVYENIYFAIGIKVACLLLGAVGIANMWFAIFADVGVMVIAVINAIRALRVK